MSPTDRVHSGERRLWRAYEPIHAICYFHPQFASTMSETGLTGWWNGYFAGRAAPLGPTPPQVVTSLFYGFSPAMVARAVPKIWTRITPEAAIEARLDAAEWVLAEHADAGSRDELRRVTDDLERVIDTLSFDGRALASAWYSVPRPTSVLQRLWLATTVLREHRGDGHVIAATATGFTGLEAAMTHIATGQVSRRIIQENRGWTDAQWASARRALLDRGILSDEQTLTPRGTALRDRIEDLTDQLAASSLLLSDTPGGTIHVLTSLARALIDRGAVPASNPIGVPRP
ncbi:MULTISPECIES: hypothetical protein [unclassified Dietzia]|uniref:SCO6745 family protein n=1 Tax=unclassified Dietzia TaxID=2617939 RepID=UPI000D20AAD7|nr:MULTISPECIES: hypothetical protein [unclassified Dietzia]AVZ39114.1 hypothetical protein CT688_06155 [Dietzia sp. JS16-p6b]QGW24311.1 hypothetical protein GJR88_01967 [Dietzia sp. DQ12-45-1b]